MMRRCYLVCYDIADPKRWRKVFRACKGFGEHWQYSIFFCVLRSIDRVRLQAELEDAINFDEDRVMILDLGENESAARTAAVTLGPPLARPLEGTVVF